MTPTEPLPLHHSWPLVDLTSRLDGGRLYDGDPAMSPAGRSAHDGGAIGFWACDLADNALRWSPEVYRLFGLPSDRTATRLASLSCYAEGSRAAMERLRAHAIRHRRGFTLDIEITPIGAGGRWLRLVAAPVCEDGRVVRLHGSKADVSHLYPRR